MECQAIFGDGNYVCQTAIVSGVVRDIVIVVSVLVLVVVAIVCMVVLFKMYRAVKRTTDRINAVVDRIEDGMDSLKPLGNALKSVGSASGGSSAKALFGALSWAVSSLYRAVARSARGSKEGANERS